MQFGTAEAPASPAAVRAGCLSGGLFQRVNVRPQLRHFGAVGLRLGEAPNGRLHPRESVLEHVGSGLLQFVHADAQRAQLAVDAVQPPLDAVQAVPKVADLLAVFVQAPLDAVQTVTQVAYLLAVFVQPPLDTVQAVTKVAYLLIVFNQSPVDADQVVHHVAECWLGRVIHHLQLPYRLDRSFRNPLLPGEQPATGRRRRGRLQDGEANRPRSRNRRDSGLDRALIDKVFSYMGARNYDDGVAERFFEQPILNSPYEYPARHWELDQNRQPTNQVVDRRRTVSFITPIPAARKRRATQSELGLDDARTAAAEDGQQYELMRMIESVRHSVNEWRRLPRARWRVTPETTRLLQHWRHHQFSDMRPFFC